jgi:hypothetical protein
MPQLFGDVGLDTTELAIDVTLIEAMKGTSPLEGTGNWGSL